MVLDDVPKKNALDDVFWMAVFNCCLKKSRGDTDKFYDVLLPFLAGRPLEEAIVKASNAEKAVKNGESKDMGAFGDWRSPGRSSTSYVRCVLESLHFMLRSRGMPLHEIKLVGLALRAQFCSFIKHDLDYILQPQQYRYL